MTVAEPLVSVGVPVRNEARFLRATLDSLLAQDYGNTEIIVSDNASTDETETIARYYADRYPCIRYYRIDEGIGPAENFNHAVERASGDYFMWAAGHDLWSTNYLSACVAELDARPQSVLAYGLPRSIDAEGLERRVEYSCGDTRGMDPVGRFFTIVWGNMNPIYGVHRRRNLLRHPLPGIIGGDLVLLSRLALAGEFVLAAGATWSRREFRSEMSYSDKLRRYRAPEYGLARTRLDRVFPLLQLPVRLLCNVLSSELPLSRKFLLLFALIPTLPVRYVVGKGK